MERKSILIVGAGFAGTMLAYHLIYQASSPLHIILADKSGNFAKGVAYSTRNPNHLLNVRAARISAFPDQPNHFAEWLKEKEELWRKLHPAFASLTLDKNDFAPRMIYGAYIEERLEKAKEEAAKKGHVLECVPWHIRHIEVEDYSCHVIADGHVFTVDAAVLAVGSLPPKDFTYEKKLFHAPERFARNVWNPRKDNVLHPESDISHLKEPIAILGSGLTMVDAVLTLRDKGFKGDILTFSRHGHLPATHVLYSPSYTLPLDLVNFPNTALGLFRYMRKEIKKAEGNGYHWQAVIDSVRPITNPLWVRLPTSEKRKFLRHLFSLWNVYRHRMPTESAKILSEMQAKGQLKHIKGSIIDADQEGEGLVISYREKYSPGMKTMRVCALLNCTGPEVDIGKLPSSELLQHLRESGHISVGTLRSGLEEKHGIVSGKGKDYLFVLGPLCFGGLFETIAVPELRAQAKELAVLLLTSLKERSNDNFAI